MNGWLWPQNAHKLSLFQHKSLFLVHISLFFPLEYIPPSLHPPFRFCLWLLVLLTLFSLWYFLQLRSGFHVFLFLSPLPPLPPFDTFLDTLLHIWSQSSPLICLWLVLQSPALGLPLCAVALPVTCCLHSSVHAKTLFHIVSSGSWMSGLAQVRNEIIEQAWGGGGEEDIPPHFDAVSISRILKSRMIDLVNTKIPWDKTGVRFPLLSVSYMHLIFPDHFLSSPVRQFFMLPHRYEELWGLYTLW